MHWFKIHHGFSSDSKLALVAHKMQESRATINGIFLDILEYASRQEDRGSLIGYNEEAAALAMGVSDKFLHEVIVTLRNVSIVTDEKVVKWDLYQGGSDATNAERQRRHREKKKQELTQEVTASNVTSPLRNTEKNRVEKIRSMEPKGSTPLIEDFEKFRDAWEPFGIAKGNRQEALKSYLKARKETDHETLIRNSATYCGNCKLLASKTKHISTWLNQRGWLDDDATGEIPASGVMRSAAGGAGKQPTGYELAMADRTHR